jgi:uncharacterized protein YndB with AHSA1/START domain
VTGTADAPVEEVWKLLFDPTRFPEWWAGVETVRADAPDRYVMWPEGYPDFPMPQHLRTERAEHRVTISCQISDIDIEWQLTERAAGTAIHVHVDLPEAEIHRLAGQRDIITRSLDRLAHLAEQQQGAATPAPFPDGPAGSVHPAATTAGRPGTDHRTDRQAGADPAESACCE